jgi:hypothetical protein
MGDLLKSLLSPQEAADYADPAIQKATDHLLKKALPYWIGTVVIFIVAVAILTRRK